MEAPNGPDKIPARKGGSKLTTIPPGTVDDVVGVAAGRPEIVRSRC